MIFSFHFSSSFSFPWAFLKLTIVASRRRILTEYYPFYSLLANAYGFSQRFRYQFFLFSMFLRPSWFMSNLFRLSLPLILAFVVVAPLGLDQYEVRFFFFFFGTLGSHFL